MPFLPPNQQRQSTEGTQSTEETETITVVKYRKISLLVEIYHTNNIQLGRQASRDIQLNIHV